MVNEYDQTRDGGYQSGAPPIMPPEEDDLAPFCGQRENCDAYILAVGLGFFGAHHFYLERYGFGVAYFLTFGFLGCGYVADLFRIPCLVRRYNETTARGTADDKKRLDDAYICWFPLGLIGAHHFYLGRTRWGFLYLFTVGLFGIGWLLDACYLPHLVKKTNEERAAGHCLQPEQKSSRTTRLFALSPIFGLLGIHHYYVGNKTFGIFYTLTLGNLGIGYVVDWFRVPLIVKRARDPSRTMIGDKPKALLDEAYLLAFPLGFMGLHNFYLGRHCWGVLYIFTIGCCGVGWVVDLIRLPCMVRKYNKTLEDRAPRGAIFATNIRPGYTHLGQVLTPIKDGQDVGVAIVPGSGVSSDDYSAIAQAIQEASDFAVWVYIEETPADPPREDFVSKSKEALVAVGLPEDAPFISTGHNVGGQSMLSEVQQTPSLVDGLVLWGADGLINPENVTELNVPTLTIGGDLDGISKITDKAKQFRGLSILPTDLRLRNQVRSLEGLNHMSITTANTPAERDLAAEIEGEPARQIIAADYAFFIDFCAREKFGQDVSGDLVQLGEWLNYQEEIYAPLINAMELELSPDGLEAPWVKTAQRIVGGAFEEEVVMRSYVSDRDGLVSSRPAVIRLSEDEVLGNTTTNLLIEDFWTSAQQVESKLSSREMFDDVLGRSPSTDPEPQCRDANVEIWNQLFPTISEKARERFVAAQYTINFKIDRQQSWGPGWVFSLMEFSSDGQTLNIESVALRTSVVLGGAHYCKLLSPFRVVEFLYVDSLRPNGF